METHTIFFIGKPGCGKGDQARLLSEKTSWKIFTAGNEFREMSVETTPVGRKMQSEMNAGLLLPNWLPTYLFLKNIFSLSNDDSVILDGFARKIPEAELVIESLAWIGRPFSVLYLKVSDEEISRRLALRKGIQDRADDSVVDERLKEYRSYTEPVVEMFRKTGVLIEIDGERTREEIAADIRKALTLE
ncbi:MAG: nucleoside monophosphate kinase [Candidatus Kaiserbacteria bacterium]|nr:nucleoside monophosphate kinase [Candidatus Kaiserbacteria bacterium]